VTKGDFNGDGKTDLATANTASDNISMLIGNGDGTFAAAVHFAGDANPLSVAAGDFNADGKTDLASANTVSNNISVLLNSCSADTIVTNVTSTTADGTYGVGSNIKIQITFSENVTVTGTPLLTLETGATDATLFYQGGSGTDTLTFSYTVAAGQSSADLDYVSASSLSTNGGTIKNANDDANLTLPEPGQPGSLGANKNIVIDTTPPTADDDSYSVFEDETLNVPAETGVLVGDTSVGGALTAVLVNGPLNG